MQQRIARLSLIGSLLLAGCAGATGASRGGDRLGDPELYPLLAEVPVSPAADSALHEYELDHRRDFLERISLVAEDPRAGTNARFNAVRILGERRASAYLPSLRIAATDRDPRVRAAVVVAAAQIAERTGEGGGLVEAALSDPSAEVVAKALERLDTANLAVLRAFVQRERRPALVQIAREIVRVPEERGAPLAADSLGVLRRAITDSITLEFQPERRWPEWAAATGTVTIDVTGSAPVRLAGIEVVRSVVPVFFSPDARHVVYEQGRRIFVRDLADGATREIGPGIAPRPLPFTNDFVFLREQADRRAELRDRIRLTYEVLRAGFQGSGEPRVIGTTTAYSQQAQSGGYSPVRWLRVVERNSVFSLEGEGTDPFHLPAVFTPGALP